VVVKTLEERPDSTDCERSTAGSPLYSAVLRKKTLAVDVAGDTGRRYRVVLLEVFLT
jgi:hypothetical protein